MPTAHCNVLSFLLVFFFFSLGHYFPLAVAEVLCPVFLMFLLLFLLLRLEGVVKGSEEEEGEEEEEEEETVANA